MVHVVVTMQRIVCLPVVRGFVILQCCVGGDAV